MDLKLEHNGYIVKYNSLFPLMEEFIAVFDKPRLVDFSIDNHYNFSGISKNLKILKNAFSEFQSACLSFGSMGLDSLQVSSLNQQKESVQKILLQIEQLIALFNQLKAFSRSEKSANRNNNSGRNRIQMGTASDQIRTEFMTIKRNFITKSEVF